MNWIKSPSLDGNPNRKQYLGLSENELTSVLHMNEVFSNIILTRVPLIHWGMIILKGDDLAILPLELLFSFKKGKNFREPTYREKLEYLEHVGIWKQIALEVMPRRQDIVDNADVYHMFEFPRPHQFRFDISPIFKAPDCYQNTEDGKYEYFIKKSNDTDVEYLYLRNKNGELRWWEKQNLKDQLLGKERYAVELIIRGMENKEYTALICLPKWWQPDFTLINP